MLSRSKNSLQHNRLAQLHQENGR